MNVVNVEQGSPEWLAVRAGKVTASRAGDLMDRTKKGGSGAARIDYLHELLTERLTGIPARRYVTQAMQWGLDNEAMARRAAAFEIDADIEPVGFVLHPRLEGVGASPDGLVHDADGEVGLIQIKCPTTKVHVASLTGKGIDATYVWQMQMELACTGLGWCWFVSFDPRLPDHLQLHREKVTRDEELISSLEAEAELFLHELEDMIELLHRYRGGE